MANFCGECGNPLSENAKFCSACGTNLDNNQYPTSENKGAGEKKSSNSFITAVAYGLIAATVLQIPIKERLGEFDLFLFLVVFIGFFIITLMIKGILKTMGISTDQKD
jgi:hypothetical protein